MDFEKVLDSLAVSNDFFEDAINFLDIKFSKISEEKLITLFYKAQAFNELKNTQNLEKRDVEKLTFEFFKLSDFEEKNSSCIEKKSDSREIKISQNDNQKVDTSNYQALKADKKFINESELLTNKENGLKDHRREESNNLSKEQKFSNDQIKFVLSFVKLAEKNLNKVATKNTQDKAIDSTLSVNKSIPRSSENIIKLNIKLFNEAFSKALKGSFDLFQTRLIEQPPFGIIAFYIKEKDKKDFLKASKKRKKRLFKKQVKYKKENFE